MNTLKLRDLLPPAKKQNFLTSIGAKPVHNMPSFHEISPAPPNSPFPIVVITAGEGDERSLKCATLACLLLTVSRKLEELPRLSKDEYHPSTQRAPLESLPETVEQTVTGKSRPLQAASPLRSMSNMSPIRSADQRDTTSSERNFKFRPSATPEPLHDAISCPIFHSRNSTQDYSLTSESTLSSEKHTFPRIRSVMQKLTGGPARIRSISVHNSQEQPRRSLGQRQISSPSTTSSTLDTDFGRYQTWPGCYVPERASPCPSIGRRQPGNGRLASETEEFDQSKEKVGIEDGEVRSCWSDDSSVDPVDEKIGTPWKPPLGRKMVRGRLDWLCGHS